MTITSSIQNLFAAKVTELI